MYEFELIKAQDPQLAKAMRSEVIRQEENIELIASENFVSPAVMEAMGSPLTNKYAEGYPGRRFYGGCEFVDVVESIAIDRAKELFGAQAANVQPHSGAQANMAVYFALIKPGDTIMGMDLSHGGHLSHGSKVNSSGKLYKSVFYGVSETDETIDYDEMLKIAKENKPKIIISGASAYPRAIDFQKIREICDEVGAYMVVDIAHIAGLVAAGLHQSPVPMADVVTTTTHKTLRGPRGGLILMKEELAKPINSAVFPGMQGGPLEHIIAAKAVCFQEALDPSFKVYQQQILNNAKVMAKRLVENGFRLVSGGTDNHLMLVDLTPFGANGKEIQDLLEQANITLNKNTIPFEKLSPSLASGVRIGTPAITTRGMKEDQCTQIADWITEVVSKKDAATAEVKKQVIELCHQFPLYQK